MMRWSVELHALRWYVIFRIEYLSKICFATTEGVSWLGINETALQLGLRTINGRISFNKLWEAHFPCIHHWNQNHFVVLYKVKKGKTFYIADPAKGLVKYNLEEFKKHWVSTQSDGEEKGIAMFLEPTPAFYEKKMDEEPKEERSFKFLFGTLSNIVSILVKLFRLTRWLPAAAYSAFTHTIIGTILLYWSVSISPLKFFV